MSHRHIISSGCYQQNQRRQHRSSSTSCDAPEAATSIAAFCSKWKFAEKLAGIVPPTIFRKYAEAGCQTVEIAVERKSCNCGQLRLPQLRPEWLDFLWVAWSTVGFDVDCEGSHVFPVCLVHGTEAKRVNWKRKQGESFHSVSFKDKFDIKGKIVEFRIIEPFCLGNMAGNIFWPSNLMLLNKRQEPEGFEELYWCQCSTTSTRTQKQRWHLNEHSQGSFLVCSEVTCYLVSEAIWLKE